MFNLKLIQYRSIELCLVLCKSSGANNKKRRKHELVTIILIISLISEVDISKRVLTSFLLLLLINLNNVWAHYQISSLFRIKLKLQRLILI